MADLSIKINEYPMYSEIEKVIQYWDKQIEEKPQEAQAFLERGKLWFILKEYNKAYEDFNRTLLLAFDNSEALEFKKVIEEHLNEKELPIESMSKLKKATKMAKLEPIILSIVIFLLIQVYSLLMFDIVEKYRLTVIIISPVILLLYVSIVGLYKKNVIKHYTKLVDYIQNYGHSVEIDNIIGAYIFAKKGDSWSYLISFVISLLIAIFTHIFLS